MGKRKMYNTILDVDLHLRGKSNIIKQNEYSGHRGVFSNRKRLQDIEQR
jgi:hypothetical protein